MEEIEQLRAGANIQEATVEERQASAVGSRQVSDALAWSEAKTRALIIDALAAKAGWDIGNNNQVTLEGSSAPAHRHRSGLCRLCTLGDDSKPLAVIEAKKTAK